MNSFKDLALFVVSGILLVGTSCTSRNDKNTGASKTDTNQVVLVKTMVVKQEVISRNIEYTATLVPFEEVHLAPAAPGRIEKINVEIGDNVAKGQVVALMDRTNLEQTRINMVNAETNFKRFDTLKKTNSISGQQYDQVKTAYDLVKNSYQFLLENTQLKAPFSGVVSGKYFEDGEIYSGTPVTSTGKPAILSIVQIDQLKAMVGIAASYYPSVKTGMKADVVSDIYQDIDFRGDIFRIYPTIDNATKTFTAEVRIQNTGMKLRPGMFAKIKLDLGQGNAIMVPTIALIKQTGTNDMYVFLNKNNVAYKQKVNTGRLIDDKTEIIEGLHEGDEVVVVGQNKLEHLMKIQISK